MVLEPAAKRIWAICCLQELSHKFDVRTNQCYDLHELRETFKDYKNKMLEQLRFAFNLLDVEIDMLVLGMDGRFRMSASTRVTAKLTLPELSLKTDSGSLYMKPQAREGLAPFACWALSNSKKPGFGIANNVTEPANKLKYYEKGKDSYDCIFEETDIYKLEYGGTAPKYKSMLTTAIYRLKDVPRRPDDSAGMELLGALNVAHSKVDAFTVLDGVWLISCALEFARLRTNFDYRRRLLESGEVIAPSLIETSIVDMLASFNTCDRSGFAAGARKVLESICNDRGAPRNNTLKLRIDYLKKSDDHFTEEIAADAHKIREFASRVIHENEGVSQGEAHECKLKVMGILKSLYPEIERKISP